MKKLSLIAALLFVCGVAVARENKITDNRITENTPVENRITENTPADRPIRVDQLPAQAQQFLREYYPHSEVVMVGEDGWEVKRYEAFLADQTKVEFLSNGSWHSIESHSPLPEGVVPSAIVSYVERNFPKTPIIGIERERRRYEVMLQSGLELTFGSDYQLVDIDD